MRLLTRTGGAVLLLLGEVAAVAALVALGDRAPFDLPLDPRDWDQARPVDALAAALRWVALGAASWLLLVTVLYVVGAACNEVFGSRRLVRVGAWLAPRSIRRVVDRCLVTTLLAGSLGTPALAFAPGASARSTPVVTIVRDGRTGLGGLPAASSTTTTALPRDPGGPGPSPPVGTPVALTSTPLLPELPRVVVVEPGDNLWDLAARELARATGRDRDQVPDAEIAPVWVAMCDANRDVLASGDVNLIFPGEVVVVPSFP